MIAKNRKVKKERRFQSIFFSILIGIFVLGTISFLIISSIRINQKRSEQLAKIEGLKKEIQVLEEQNQKLKTGLIQTQSETYWEGKLREEGYKKPGEETVVVLPPEENGEQKTQKDKGFWQTILEKLGF